MSSIFNWWGGFSENPRQQSLNFKKTSLYKTEISNAGSSESGLASVGGLARLDQLAGGLRECRSQTGPTQTPLPVCHTIAGIVPVVEVGYHWRFCLFVCRWYEFLRLMSVMSLSVPVSLVSLRSHTLAFSVPHDMTAGCRDFGEPNGYGT